MKPSSYQRQTSRDASERNRDHDHAPYRGRGDDRPFVSRSEDPAKSKPNEVFRGMTPDSESQSRQFAIGNSKPASVLSLQEVNCFTRSLEPRIQVHITKR